MIVMSVISCGTRSVNSSLIRERNICPRLIHRPHNPCSRLVMIAAIRFYQQRAFDELSAVGNFSLRLQGSPTILIGKPERHRELQRVTGPRSLNVASQAEASGDEV